MFDCLTLFLISLEFIRSILILIEYGCEYKDKIKVSVKETKYLRKFFESIMNSIYLNCVFSI